MQYIISANYRDRQNTTHPWLVRTPDQSVSEGIPVASLTAKNVTFQDSGELEKGFGCEIVAVSDDVTFQKDADVVATAPAGRGLRFYGHKFVAKATGERVDEVGTLVLSNDRKVTDVSEGVTPDDTNSAEEPPLPEFARGTRVVFIDDELKEEKGPRDMVGEGNMIVVSFGVDDDGDIKIHYDDGTTAGDTFWARPEYLKNA